MSALASPDDYDPSKPLNNPRHERFARNIALRAMSQADAYREVYGNDKIGARCQASTLLSDQNISNRVRFLSERGAEKDVLSHQEKRAWLAKVVRTPVGEVDQQSPLCQSYKITEGLTEYKMVDKLKALELDARLAGELKEQTAITVNMLAFKFE